MLIADIADACALDWSFVAEGRAQLPGAAALRTGDAARLTDAGALDVTAGDDGAHVVVWETYSTLG